MVRINNEKFSYVITKPNHESKHYKNKYCVQLILIIHLTLTWWFTTQSETDLNSGTMQLSKISLLPRGTSFANYMGSSNAGWNAAESGNRDGEHRPNFSSLAKLCAMHMNAVSAPFLSKSLPSGYCI